MKNKINIPDEIISLDMEKIDFNDNETVKRLMVMQHNVIVSLVKIMLEQGQENQNLKDEINRLKG